MPDSHGDQGKTHAAKHKQKHMNEKGTSASSQAVYTLILYMMLVVQ